MKHYLAVDIGGTFVKFGIIDEQASIQKIGKVKTPKTLEGLLDLVGSNYKNYPEIVGVAISCPGAVSESGMVYGTSALPYIHGPNVKQLLSKRLGLPVYMENDANCAGYAEVWKGKARGRKDVLIVVIGTGVGERLLRMESFTKVPICMEASSDIWLYLIVRELILIHGAQLLLLAH
ncbi:ROK family protein [Virgibacillus soli]|uniref:ROK family protein n=1 Tax=Paracerasibacillus soli TaxID=480284 RepID=A0ABU5CSG7_9BACI|nr:ROK family protein [Virgibacillus soli]MDY0409327.1 ROK family protein [Virgibacillus soli]